MLGTIRKLFLKAIGGSRNERIIRGRMKYVVERINPLEERMQALDEQGILDYSHDLRRRLADGEPRESIKVEAFALVREAARRALDIRLYDVQLVAGLILDDGWIAEEATGEGKTFACYPAVYMAVLEGMHAHVVTVNDYLVQRDAGFAAAAFSMLGVTVGFITNEMPAYGAGADDRRQAYSCDITYGTNSEFGFDYLRDNMKMSLRDQVQGPLGFAIIDEVDNILIDEARTPLIISGPAYGDIDRYRKADVVAREIINRSRPWQRANARVESLKRDIRSLEGELDHAKGDEREGVQKRLDDARRQLAEAEDELADTTRYYEVEMDRKAAYLTHEGVGLAQETAGVGSFYVGANMEWPHLMEQALRAHLVYERDKDYVVQNNEVIIVDEFTGRLMQGRQWSDGLHQAVEAKERVTIKEETQTMATITLQNYFKLYDKLAGMTGTAMTEAGEFLKIYKLDAATVPTHRPVNRVDHNDRIYADTENKYKALVEEIRHYSRELGRPVLVGTTSVEKSEKLADMLTRSYGIAHEVLNARPENAAREADIVTQAGQQLPLKKGSDQMVGNVTIATNMAGRGTDIKLGPGVVYPNCKVPPTDEIVRMGLEVEDLFPPGATKCCIRCPQYDPATRCAHCFKPKLDGDFPSRGRTDCIAECPCGLHIVGTERHEARRIDNQLRGRSGRQGDPGSSRFFLSLRDELMAIFAGDWTLKVLGWLGLQGDAAIEDKRVSKGIERAQRKVEQRNFEIRKNLLEYDEVMDYQRRDFYARRQRALAGRELEGLVMQMIAASVDDAVDSYLAGDYRQRCIAEAARQLLRLPAEALDASQISARDPEDFDDLEQYLRRRAREEAGSNITMTLGEYMDPDLPAREWDLKGLSGWAMSRFGVNLSQNQLRKMDPSEVEAELTAAAGEKIDQTDLTPLAMYLEPDYPQAQLAEWARSKFLIDISPEEFGDEQTGGTAAAADALMEKVAATYRRREIEYPVEHALDMTLGSAEPGNVYAARTLADWANRKYEAGLTGDELRDRSIAEIRRQLVELSEQWNEGGRLQEQVRQAVGDDGDVDAAIEFADRRFGIRLNREDFDDRPVETVIEAGKKFLRREMTELERFVLLQVLDSSWKDHLLAMDHLKSGIGLRGFAQQDPRVAFKREGSRQYEEMLVGVNEKITDMIFKVRLSGEAKMQSVYQVSDLVHEQMSAYDQLSQEMVAQQQAAQDAGESAKKVQTIIRETPKVGRNDPCPCGSGKKYKKCCGKNL